MDNHVQIGSFQLIKQLKSIVLIKYIDAEAVILLMTRLPSLTICGMALKLFFNKTICEALLAASLPEAIAIESICCF